MISHPSPNRVVLRSKAVEILLEQLDHKSLLIMVIIDLLRVLCAARKGDTEAIINHSKRAISTLIHVIQHSISTQHQHKAFEILWLIAGEDLQERRALANLVGPVGLTKMLDASSDKHLRTATTALSLLSPPHHGRQREIVENGAVLLLLGIVQRLETGRTETLLRALSILENCTHEIGMRPIEETRYAFLHERGVQTLLRLQATAEEVGVQLQALCTLAAFSLGSPRIKKEIVQDPSFSVRQLIRFLRDSAPDGNLATPHTLLAMRTLCYLAYGSLEVQTVIVNTRPLPSRPFLHLMSAPATDDERRMGSEVAFHAAVLAKLFDKDEVAMAADAIRYLVKTLRRALEEGEDELQMHICTHVSGLLHMRAGICDAFVAAGLVSLLARVLTTPFEHCRKAAAIALSYVSRDTEGGRAVLACCRSNAKLYGKIVQYGVGYELGQGFVERWERYRAAYHSKSRQQRLLERRKTSHVISLAFKGARLFSE